MVDTEVKKYDVVIIGGGPASLGFICNLFQTKANDKFFQNLNILIIEKSNTFGSGCLGLYGINTNTSSEGFSRIICYKDNNKSGKLALSPSRKTMKNSKNFIKKSKLLKVEEKLPIFRPLNIFRELYESATVKTLLAIGNRPAPLLLVGNFLETVGNFILDYIYKNYNKLIFQPNHTVNQIKINGNEEFILTLEDKEKKQCNIKAKQVVLATGGVMNISPLFFQITNIKQHIFLSEDLLKNKGYKQFVDKIKLIRSPKIVIIGGSHSGFSSAWIILNSFPKYNKIGDDIPCKTLSNCNNAQCLDKVCYCLGSVNNNDWNIESSQIENLEIQILYRDSIKVFYSSEEEAEKNNYKNYDRKKALNNQGKIYPFVGLRGDAKELYHKIIKKEETRIELIKTKSDTEQINLIEKSDIVIWACGYSSNGISFVDNKNNHIELAMDQNRLYDVDKTLNLMFKNKVKVPNLFGIGQGYSTRAPEIINGVAARADSINLYNTIIAVKLFKALEPFLNKQIAYKQIINDKQYLNNQKRSNYHSFKAFKTNPENNLNEKKSNLLFNKNRYDFGKVNETNNIALNKKVTFENKTSKMLSKAGQSLVNKNNLALSEYVSNSKQNNGFILNKENKRFNNIDKESLSKNAIKLANKIDDNNTVKNKTFKR